MTDRAQVLHLYFYQGRNAFLIRQGFLTIFEILEDELEKSGGRNAFLIRQGFLTVL